MRDTFDQFQPRERGRFGDNEVERLPNRGGKKLHDLACDVIERRERAVKVRLHANGRTEWFPLAHCEVSRSERQPGARNGHTITVPEWLLNQKGIL